MMGKQVSFIGRENRKVSGITEQVCRNIFDNMVEITINGRLFCFKEPNIISLSPGNQSIILFVYGKPVSDSDMSDKALFDEVRASLYKGETIDDVIFRTKPMKTKVVRFTLLPIPAN